MKNFKILIPAFLALFFAGCAQPKVYDYSALQSAKPKSILVLMPTNETTEVKGAAAVLANSVAPLSEAGYYVFSPALVNDTFKANGVYKADDIAKISLDKLRGIFGADAILYLHIDRYGANYKLINSSTEVGVNATLKDAKTGATLWQKYFLAVQNSNDSSSGGLGGLLANVIIAAIAQVANDVGDAAYDLSGPAMFSLLGQNCNDCLLYGPKSPYFGQDKQLAK